MSDTYPPVPEPGVPLAEQTICRKIIGGPGGTRCGGDMVRVGMTQEWERDLSGPDPEGAWFYETKCSRCGRIFDLPVPNEVASGG